MLDRPIAAWHAQAPLAFYGPQGLQLRRLTATIHLDSRNIRCLKDARNRLNQTETRRSAQRANASGALNGIASQMKVGTATATMCCGSQATQALALCDTGPVSCFPCEHIAVFARRPTAGFFHQPEEQE
ncbi:MAG TPA: hypothetical protein VHV99_14575 [Paraburkholderia sp.]|jgi:hypothetical protein|nr:hypothetical protein [Paraburkholderia sp.]